MPLACPNNNNIEEELEMIEEIAKPKQPAFTRFVCSACKATKDQRFYGKYDGMRIRCICGGDAFNEPNERMESPIYTWWTDRETGELRFPERSATYQEQVIEKVNTSIWTRLRNSLLPKRFC